jgi:hypothetical protein
MTTQNPLASGFTCVVDIKDLGYPIRQSLESLEPVCDEIVISVPSPHLLGDGALEELEKLKESYNHPKFIFIEYGKKSWLGRWGNLVRQWHSAKRLCRGRTKIGLRPARELPKSKLSKLHNRTVMNSKKQGLRIL